MVENKSDLVRDDGSLPSQMVSLKKERRTSPRELRESLRQVGRTQGEVRKPKCQRRHY